MSRFSLLALLALATPTGCVRSAEFRCSADTECVRSGTTGTCEPVGYCSFPDPECAEGRRFGEAAAGYSGACVDGGTTMFDAPPGFYTIGGSISGLTGTIVLRNNDADDLSRSTSGSFVFATAQMTGTPYAVTIASSPSGQVCSLANETGTVANANVTTIAVTCTTVVVGAGILCAPTTMTECEPSTQFCCFNRSTATGTCLADADLSCITQRMDCNDAEDCGGGTNVCCARYGQMSGFLGDVTCKASEATCLGGPGANTYEIWCDPAAPVCPAGKTCTGSTGFSGYSKCI